jgi:hypothetical protein
VKQLVSAPTKSHTAQAGNAGDIRQATPTVVYDKKSSEESAASLIDGSEKLVQQSVFLSKRTKGVQLTFDAGTLMN